MKTLIILRGVSGAGKSTIAELFSENGKYPICEADHWHYNAQGVYGWTAENMHLAHKNCRSRVSEAMLYDVERIIVSNTSTTEKELAPYLDLAEKYGYRVVSLVVENRHGGNSIHDVPQETRDA